MDRYCSPSLPKKKSPRGLGTSAASPSRVRLAGQLVGSGTFPFARPPQDATLHTQCFSFQMASQAYQGTTTQRCDTGNRIIPEKCNLAGPSWGAFPPGRDEHSITEPRVVNYPTLQSFGESHHATGECSVIQSAVWTGQSRQTCLISPALLLRYYVGGSTSDRSHDFACHFYLQLRFIFRQQ